MDKKDAIALFGSMSRLARAIGISQPAVSMWPDKLPARLQDRVIAAAVRSGIEVPKEWLKPRVRELASGRDGNSSV